MGAEGLGIASLCETWHAFLPPIPRLVRRGQVTYSDGGAQPGLGRLLRNFLLGLC